MSIASLGRSLAGAALRDPVAPLSAQEQRNARAAPKTEAVTELADTQVVTDVEKTLTKSVQPEQQQRPSVAVSEADVASAVDQFQKLMRRNSVEFSATGPLSRPELTIVDHINKIDFERALPPAALKEHLFELRQDFIAGLQADRISVDASSPLSSRVIVIKDNINDVEFVRHLPRRLNQERLDGLIAFASEQGFNFETVA
jgi:hypothetical protein